jgi:hypothetical protein
MLTPEQLGVVAQLVHDAIAKFPNKAPDQLTTAKVFQEADYMEPWEKWLKTQVNTKTQKVKLPSYDEIGDEVEMFVHYFAYNEHRGKE